MTPIVMEFNINKAINLQQISTLPITTNLQKQILSILTEPFHDKAETQQAWDELQCELWFLTSISGLTADSVDGADIEQLERALTYTEFFLSFPVPLRSF